MPGLELHKTKLQLAAAAGRLPDVASIDSYWLPLFANDVQPLEPYWPAEDRADFLPFTIQTLSDPAGHVLGLWHETDCRVLFYRKDLVPVPPRTWDELLDTASRVAREQKMSGYLYNAGRWEATVFDHLAMFWAQGGELVDRDGRPIFGEEPNRRAMLRVLGFLRDTIQRGASPRSVLGHTDYQQLTGAAVAGDAAMFLGGNWQLKDLQTGLSPAEFAKWDIAPIPQADANTRSTGTGGWVWVVFAQGSRAAARGGRVHPRRRGAGARGAHQRGDRPSAGAPQRLPRLSDLQPGLVVPPLRRDARRRPRAADGADLPGDVAAAAARDRRGRVRREDAGAGARRGVAAVDAEYARQTSSRSANRDRRRPDRLDPDDRSPASFRSRCSGAAAATAPAPARWALPATALVTIILFYPMLDLLRLSLTDATVAGTRYAYTLASYRALLTDASFYGMVGVTVDLRRRLGGPAARHRLRDRVADRRGAPAPRARHAGRARRGRQRLGDPRRARRRALEDPADREPLGDRQLLPGAGRPRAAAADLVADPRARLGRRRQRLARLRLQHDPALRRPAAGAARAARGGRPRGRVGVAAAALAADPAARAGDRAEPGADHDRVVQHVRSDHPADRRRAGAAHRGDLAVHVPPRVLRSRRPGAPRRSRS